MNETSPDLEGRGSTVSASKGTTGKTGRWQTWPTWKKCFVVTLTVGTAMVIAGLCIGLPIGTARAPDLRSLNSDLTIVLNNDLESYDDVDALLVLNSPQTHAQASKHCTKLFESLSNTTSSVYKQLLPRLQTDVSATQRFWTASSSNKTCQAVDATGSFHVVQCGQRLPALCTQSAPAADLDFVDLSQTWHIEMETKDRQKLTGYRDRRSFRFFGIPFAEPPARWNHSVLARSKKPIEALRPGAICKQKDVPTSSEDCLFLDVYTPFLPATFSGIADARLRPVMVFIHGGSFTSGDASDNFSDGGNLASRGDVVMVSINYRVGIFGFLTLDNGITKGNYGLGDQITALQWVKRNIRSFGGDPDQITVFGQSAGAASVRALLSSPLTEGFFHAAIMQSSPGGLGMGGPYSHYLNTSEAMRYIDPVLDATNCARATSQLDCLLALSANNLVENGNNLLQLDGVNQAFLVEDGKILNASALPLDSTGYIARVPVILGTMRDDGAYFLPGPSNRNLTSSLLAAPMSLPDTLALGLSQYANTTSYSPLLSEQAINSTDEDLAAFDVFNVTNHISTLGIFSCNAQATALAGSLHALLNTTYLYEMNRAFNWYPDITICNAPVSKRYPSGDPYTSLNCHGGDNPYVFGNLKFLRFDIRDEYDYPFARQMLDSWASFARTGNPNPDPQWMQMMGYSLDYGLNNADSWTPTFQGNTNIRRLGPIGSAMIGEADSEDLEFCNLMNLGQTTYV